MNKKNPKVNYDQGYLKAEEDPSGRAKCFKCKEVIKKGSQRMERFAQRPTDKYATKALYCADCGLEYLLREIESLYEIVEALNGSDILPTLKGGASLGFCVK